MSVIVYRSTDASGPGNLTNSAGSLITVLDAILVNGYSGKAAQGYTKTAGTSNRATYTQGSGNGFLLRVDDNTANNAQLRGFETITAVDSPSVGDPAFPTTTQVAYNSGPYFYRAASANRPWMAVGNGKLLIFVVDNGSNNCNAFIFGDIKSYKSGDAKHTVMLCETSTNSFGTSQMGAVAFSNAQIGATTPSATAGSWIARSYTGVGSSQTLTKVAPMLGATGTQSGGSGLPYPNGPDGSMYLSPCYLLEAGSGHLRGTIPGLWCVCHNITTGIATGDTMTGSGALAGKTFEFRLFNSSSPVPIAIEISDTWDA